MSPSLQLIRTGSRCARACVLFFFSAALSAGFSAAAPSVAQDTTPIRIDASQPFVPPGPASYNEFYAKSPSGGVLGVNSRYLTLDGKPWLPVMGEFHFSRYPRSQWEPELLKMKAAGVQVVATYVIWIHHEEVEGQFDWQGRRDLRAFAQLCAKHGMYLEPRIGPWDHAEARNGGFPDWLLKKGPTRVNDPVYLSYVRAWYGEIGRQLQGLMWQDGGPVIGIQLENEYSKRGPGAGEAHILELKKLAIASGLKVPLYLVTGWDNAVVPPRAVIPVYGGGYPDAPWDSSPSKLPPAEVYDFRFQSRVAANMGAIGGVGADGAHAAKKYPLPYLTAEIGGGIEDTYHRRPVIHPDDIAAMMPVMLGSGVNLYGTYMFQGGENPDGKLSTLQESQETGYPTDVPVKSYDFQAPLGEFGQERESFRKLKVFQYFLNDFGAELAPMMVHAPETLPKNPADFSVPRASIRSRGESGFIFLNNYVRGYSMPSRPAAQFEIRLPDGVLKVPRRPVEIPSGAYFIWPFNLRMADITLRYSTAQLFTRLTAASDASGITTYYFAAVPGIAPEFAFDAQGIRSVQVSNGSSVREEGVIYLRGIQPGLDAAIDLVGSDGQRVRVVVLSEREAEDAWKVRIGGREHLLLTAQDFYADPDASPARIWIESRASAHFAFRIAPPPAVAPASSLPLTETGHTALFTGYSAQAKPFNAQLQFRLLQPAGPAAAVRIGPVPSWRTHGVAEAPTDAAFHQAAKWSITVPAGTLDGLGNLFLQVDYQGDVARFSAAHRLLDDNFYNGQPWMIGLRRFLASEGPSTFELSILPLRKDSPVYFELPGPLDFSLRGQIGKLDSLRLVPEYQLILDAGKR